MSTPQVSIKPEHSDRAPLFRLLRWGAVGWGLVLAYWPLAAVAFSLATAQHIQVPFEVSAILFYGYAAASSSLVWVSFLRLVQDALVPRWPRWSWAPVATGLYLAVGAGLTTAIAAGRSLEGVQFNFWAQPSFALLVLLAWPFMTAFLAVFTPR